MKKAVIFDLDGLLIDTESTCFKIYGDLVRKYGHELTLAAYTERYSGKALIDNVNQFIADFDLPITLEEGAEFYTSNEKVYFDRGILLKPGAEELLKKLKARGVRIILATSSVRDRAVGVLRANGVDGYFDDMVFGPEVEHGKPAPDVFLKAHEKAGERAEDCLVLEDSEAGVQAAYAAGIDVICVPDIKAPSEAVRRMAWAVLPSLYEVSGILQL